METEKKIVGRCPLCGGNVVKTCKGYRCENNIGENPTCCLNINGILGNRKMSDEEITEFLTTRRIMLDGFATKEGKTFPTVLELGDDGSVNMQSAIGKCPHCGGDIRVGAERSTAQNSIIPLHHAPSLYGATSAVTSSHSPRYRKSARRKSLHWNLRCSG